MRMRKLNVKLFLALLAGAALFAGAVWGVHAFQYQRIAAALLWQSRHAEQDGKFDVMARYLTRYLEFAPHDLEQAAHLGAELAGEHFSGLAARRQAYYVLNNVVNQMPERADLQRLLIKTALDIGEWNAAKSALEALAKNPAAGPAGSPERGELEGDWGRLLAAQKKPDEAIEHSRLAVEQAPSDEDNYIRLAWLLRGRQDLPAEQRAKDAAEADKVINDLVAKNPASPRAHLARWRYRREFDLLDLRDSQDPNQVSVEKAAEEDVDVALSQAPESVDALVARADAEVLLHHPQKAYDSLQQGLKLQATPGYHAASDMGEFELLWHLATLLLSDAKLADNVDRTAEVEEAINRIRKTRGQPAAADYLEARLLIHQKDWAKAAALLERTRPALAAQQAHADLLGQIDLSLGQCYLALEEPGQAERAYKIALAWDPRRADARIGLGEAQRMLGRLDEALENYQKAADGAQNPGNGWLEVARLEIMRQLQQDKRDWSRAEDAIDRAARAIPKDAREAVEPVLLRAEILAMQARWDDAAKLLKDAHAAHPDRADFWTALADLAVRRDGDQKAALAVLDEADAALHDQAALRVCRALHLAADGSKASLDALDALAKKDLGSLGAEDREKVLGGLAEAEARAGRPEESARLLEELAGQPGRRNDLRLRLTLFDLALKRHDVDGTDKALKAIREVEGGEGAFYGLGQALRSIDRARADRAGRPAALDDAWKALERAAALRPDWPPVEMARADVDDLGNNPEGAIKHLQEAVRLEQGRVGPAVIQRLVEALYNRGRFAEAGEYIDKLRQSLLVNSPLGRLAAGVALGAGNVDRAKELIEKAAEAETTNYHDLLLRARIQEALNRPAEAEECYRKATTLAPEEPAVWVAYVQYLGNHDKQATAEGLIKNEVAAKAAKDKAELAVAECYEALAMGKDANEHYDAAVKAAPDDAGVARAVAAFKLRVGKVAEAKTLLERVAEGPLKDKASEADVEWARRGLATVLASSTNYGDFRKALELVGLKLDESGVLMPEPKGSREENADVRRARARVLATQPQRQFRQQSIKLLEGLQPPDADDLFLLALLYEADGNQSREAEILKGLAALDDRRVRPGHLALYAQVLMRQGKSDRGRLDEGADVVGRLERLERDRQAGQGAFGTVELRALLLEARGEGQKALDGLLTYAHRRDARPTDTLMVVSSLGRQKRYAEAFDLCDKEDLVNKCPPALVCGLCEGLLRAMPSADEQRGRVERWLVQAIKDHPDVTALKMHLADHYDLRGDYPRAEEEYREVLKAEPGNVVALNNLACLMVNRTGEGAEALQYAEAAIDGIGRRADLLDTRGLAHLALNQTGAALSDFTEACNDSPSASRLFHLARAQLQARDRDAALRTLHRAKTDFGLEPAGLHPTEQQVCQSLLSDLKVK